MPTCTVAQGVSCSTNVGEALSTFVRVPCPVHRAMHVLALGLRRDVRQGRVPPYIIYISTHEHLLNSLRKSSAASRTDTATQATPIRESTGRSTRAASLRPTLCTVNEINLRSTGVRTMHRRRVARRFTVHRAPHVTSTDHMPPHRPTSSTTALHGCVHAVFSRFSLLVLRLVHLLAGACAAASGRGPRLGCS